MPEWNLTGSRMFSHAAKFIDAYHTVLQPLCRETGLPPMAMDILLFVANNPDSNTASDICQCRGLKPGIVSVHVDRLVNEGLMVRAEAADDRRKTRLTCTGGAAHRRRRPQAAKSLCEQTVGRHQRKRYGVLPQDAGPLRGESGRHSAPWALIPPGD